MNAMNTGSGLPRASYLSKVNALGLGVQGIGGDAAALEYAVASDEEKWAAFKKLGER